MKSYNQFIIESSNSKNIVVIDVQPTYQKGIHFNLKKFYNFIKDNYDTKNVYWVFDEIDSRYDIYDMVNFITNEEYFNEEDKSANEIYEFFDSINIVTKEYGFFKNVMDKFGSEIALKLAKEMVKNNLHYISDDEDYEGVLNVDEEILDYAKRNGFSIPDLDDLKQLKTCDICGGGEDECLLEVSIVLDLYEVEYKKLRKWIY